MHDRLVWMVAMGMNATLKWVSKTSLVCLVVTLIGWMNDRLKDVNFIEICFVVHTNWP
jgi:hypothetical protein